MVSDASPGDSAARRRAADVPAALLAQLAPGGRLLIPVGNSARQELLSIRQTAEGVVREHVELVNFVPLVQDVS